MLKFSKKTNLLERTEFEFPLQDVSEPNLFRNLFSYEEVPKTAFNHRHVPINMPEDIWITDTTFRDGQQSQQPYEVKHIVHLYDLLHRLGGPHGVIRQSEFFLYSGRDREAVQECLARGYEFPEVTSWIRASAKDFQLVKDMGVKETGILVSCSDYHIFNKLNMTRRQAIDHYMGIIKDCIAEGIRPRCHFEDITRADIYGFVVPFVTQLMRVMQETGMPVKIRACDTMGLGLHYPGVVLPRSVPGIIHGLNHHGRVPSELIEWHGHNDFYKAVSNAATAWLFGASAVNCSLLGIGERTGNCPLEAMVIEYAQFKGSTDGMDLTVISEIAEYMEREMGYEIPPMTPFVGKNFNVTRAGIHADGLAKDEEIYNIFNTEKLLNRPVKVNITSTSGLAGIAHWINSNCDLKQSVDKRSDLVVRVKQWVDEQYASGRVTSITDHELQNVTEAVLSELNDPPEPARLLG